MKKEKTLAKHMNGNPIEMREMEYESLLQNVGNDMAKALAGAVYTICVNCF